jgi:nitronate monooxygenase
MSVLSDLGATNPVVAAPMAGGPTTPALVVAAAAAGSVGFLAAGYLDAAALTEQVETVAPATDLYGVNLFAPHPVAVDPVAYTAYRDLLAAEAERLDLEPSTLPEHPVEDDDAWQDKVDVLVAHQVPLVSFTFGLPDPSTVAALRGAGSRLAQTVTSADEAIAAAEAGLDVVLVQASSAGGHSGTFTPALDPEERPLIDLVAEVRAAVRLPVLAAGGLGTSEQVAAVLEAGAEGALVGTALLLADEAGTSAAHRAGLVDHSRETTVMRAFTGRPARGLRNRFSEQYNASAPTGYPALHHLTRPLRRAAIAAGDPDGVNLWAGTGFRSASSVPAAEILRTLGGTA